MHDEPVRRVSIDDEHAEKQPLVQRGRTTSSIVIPGTKKARDLVDKDRWQELRSQYAVTLAALVWLSVGVALLMVVDGYEFIEALYISVQLITTVGYGDFIVSPKMELFMAMYLLGCIIWVAFAFSTYTEALQEMSTQFLRMKMHVAEQRLGIAESESDASKLFGRFNDLTISTFFFFVMLMIGTVFMRAMEHCSCMDVVNVPIPGCEVGPQCKSTGGRILTWWSSFYLSVVTLTTCGFGDLHPSTKPGMAFACVWILTGVAATANFIRAFVGYFCVYWKKHYILTEKITGRVFDEIDAMDGVKDGMITRDSYKLYLIQKFGLVDQSILDTMDKQFDLLDRASHQEGIVRCQTMQDIYEEDDQDQDYVFGRWRSQVSESRSYGAMSTISEDESTQLGGSFTAYQDHRSESA